MKRDQLPVKLVRWPAESGKRKRCIEEGALRLLVIEGGAPAPLCSDVREDWVRAPISRADLHARIATLRAKSFPYTVPRVDPSGALTYRDGVVAVSPAETVLLERLTSAFQSLVLREELQERLEQHHTCKNRNALDLHIMRIRRRIRPLSLAVQTAWGRGYILEPAAESAV